MTKDALKYVAVGVLGLVVYFVMITVLVEVFAVDAVVASSLMFLWVILQSYVLNHSWTFKSSVSHLVTFPRYIAVCSIGFITNSVIMTTMVNYYNVYYLYAQTCAVIVIPMITFSLNRFWSFSHSNNERIEKGQTIEK